MRYLRCYLSLLFTTLLCTCGIAQDTLHVVIPDPATGELVLMIADDAVRMIPPGAVPGAVTLPPPPCTGPAGSLAALVCTKEYVATLRDTLMALDTFNASQYAFNANVYIHQLGALPPPADDAPMVRRGGYKLTVFLFLGGLISVFLLLIFRRRRD